METALQHIKHLHAQMNMNSLQLGKGPTWKKKVGPTYTTPEEFENATMTVHFRLMFEENSGIEITF